MAREREGRDAGAGNHPFRYSERMMSKVVPIPSTVAWGDVAEWVTGIATLLLFFAAVIAAIYAARTWREAKAANAVREEERRQEQASQIASWVVRKQSGGYSVLMRNPTAQPIYDVRFVVAGYGEVLVKELIEGDREIIPPDFYDQISQITNDEAQKTRGAPVVDGEIDTRGHLAEDFRVSFRFRDAAGMSWIRRDNGRLESGELSVLARQLRKKTRAKK